MEGPKRQLSLEGMECLLEKTVPNTKKDFFDGVEDLLEKTVPAQTMTDSYKTGMEALLVQSAGPVASKRNEFPSFPGVTIEKLVVQSGQAAVFKGMYLESLKLPVAVKVFYFDRDAEKAFVSEVMSLRQLKHKNILQMEAVFEQPQFCIVTKWMERGALNEYLRQGRLEWDPQGRKFALDIAQGLSYLHGQNVIHRDVKSLNVLIGVDGTAVLADFGFAKSVETNSVNEATSTIGSPYWMSPEMIEEEKFSAASDMYAYGIIVWELQACKMPYEDLKNRRQLENAVVSGQRPLVDASWPKEARDLMMQCWHAEPGARLKAADVVKILSIPFDSKKAVTMKGQSPVVAENLEDLCKQGNKLLEKKQMADACALFRKALCVKSGSVEIMELISKCVHNSGDYVGALVMYEKILEQDSKDKTIEKLAKDLQKYLAGQKWYRLDKSAPLTSASDLTRAKNQSGEQMATGNYASALRSLHFVLLFEPTNTGVLQSVGVCLQKLLKCKEAIFAYQVLLALTSDRSDKVKLLETIAGLYDYLKLPKDAKATRAILDKI